MNLLFDILISWRIDFADDDYKFRIEDALILTEVTRFSERNA